jgi:hypothetical protein
MKATDRYPLDSNYSLTRHLVDTLDGKGPVMSAERGVHFRIKEQFGIHAPPEGRDPLPRQTAVEMRDYGPRMSFKGDDIKVAYLPFDAFGRVSVRSDVGGGAFTTLAPVDVHYTSGVIAHSKVFALGAQVWEGLQNQAVLPGTTPLGTPGFSSQIGTQQTLSGCTLAAYSETVTCSSTTGLAAGMLVSGATPGQISPSTIVQQVVNSTTFQLSQPALQSGSVSLTLWAAADGTSQLPTSQPTFLGGTSSGNSLILQPYRLGVRLAVSKQLLAQSPKLFTPILRQQLSKSISSAIDNMALFSTGGANAQPTGVFAACGSPAKLGSAITWINYQAYRTAIFQTDLDLASYGGIVSPAMLSYLDQTQAYGAGTSYSISEKVRDDTESRFLVGNEINSGTPMNTGTGAVFGLFDKFFILLWGDGMSVEFDPYSLADSNETVVRAFVLMNCAVPWPAAFCCPWQ